MAAAPTEDSHVLVAADLLLPAGECCTQTLGTVAAKGAGKSYLAGVIVEGLYAAGAPFAVFDPVGNWSSVTLAADGKGPGLGVVVIGGERADVPLDEERAEVIGGFLLERGSSVVFDVSELSKSKRKGYVAAVAEGMFRAARRVKRPYMVVLEEAQVFAPQHAARGEERMLGAITDIVRLGRNHGLGSMLITQRPQSVSKEVLNMIECLFVGNLRGPQERKAIQGWVNEQGADEARAALADLPQLAPGEFFCWSPSWLRTFKKIRVSEKWTFDGSSTPTLGQRLAPVHRSDRSRNKMLEQLITALGGLSHRLAHESDVGERDGEAAELRKRLAAATREIDQLRAEINRLNEIAAVARSCRDSLAAVTLVQRTAARLVKAPRNPVTEAPVPDDTAASGSTSSLDGAALRVLQTLAWQSGPIAKRRLALLCRYSPKGGGFGNVLSRLRKPGFITGSTELAITAAGRKEAGPVEQPPREPRSLLEWWLAHPRVDGPMGVILRAAVEHGKPTSAVELAKLAGYAPNTGGFNNPLSRLRVLGLMLGGKGEIRITPELMGG